MKCPHCIIEILIALEFNEVEIDYCTQCKGIWLDSGELELLLGNHEKTKTFLSIGSPAQVPEGEKSRKCPECDKKMTKESTQSDPPVIFDHCPENHGLWLDAGELHTILDHMDSEIGSNEIGQHLRDMFATPNE